MKASAIIASAAGIALAAWLLKSFGVNRILDLLAHAGWQGLSAVVLFHLGQILLSAAGWRALAGGGPGLASFTLLRWIREGVNNLLPVAQVGGEVVGARLLQRRGMRLTEAVASVVADLTVEMLTQVVFTLLGLFLLLHAVGRNGVAGSVAIGLVVGTAVAGGFLAAQWLGLGTTIEKGLLRLGGALGWAGTETVQGLGAALIACYRTPRRVLPSTALHLACWLSGGAEICLVLHVLGHDVGLATGLVIESLGQALKAAGFAVPGALGVQEGGIIVVCQLFGLAPELALALSLAKRLREVVLGVPALIAWRLLESKPALPPSRAQKHPLPEFLS